MRSAVAVVYAAAALSFGAGVLRDWQLVHHVDGYQQVFGAMYSVALAASFSVNAATLGHGFNNQRRRQGLLLLISLVLFAVLAQAWQPMAPSLFWLMLPVPVLYVVGALYARRLLDAGHVLLGRIRDGLSSLWMVLLIALGMGSPSFPVSVLFATAMVAVVAHRMLKDEATEPVLAVAMPLASYIGVLFYSNVATVAINAWAMWANGVDGTVFGFATPVAVRVAMYCFQLFSLPSVLLSRWRHAVGSPRIWTWLTWVSIALAALAANLPLEYSIFVFPIAALACLYSAVLHMNARHFRKPGN